MLFEVVDFNDKEKWEKITGKNVDIYYQTKYIYPFYKYGDGKPTLIYAKDGENIVFNVFFIRDIGEELNLNKCIENNKYYDIITPYGYGGADVINKPSCELIEYFFEKQEKYFVENNVVSEFIRFNPLNNNNEHYKNTKYEIIKLSNTVYMSLNNDEQIWTQMESRCRNTIRKAQKMDIKIKIGFNKKMIDEFQNIYYETMKRDNAKQYYFFNENFFNNYYNTMKENSIIVTAYKEKIPISSSLFIYSDKNAHYHLSGTLTNYLKLGANSLILYEAAKKLRSIGCQRLHLGGGYGGNDSPLLKFKKSFSKNELLDYYVGKKIYNKAIYDKLVGIRGKETNFDNTSSFFPLYRI